MKKKRHFKKLDKRETRIAITTILLACGLILFGIAACIFLSKWGDYIVAR